MSKLRQRTATRASAVTKAAWRSPGARWLPVGALAIGVVIGVHGAPQTLARPTTVKVSPSTLGGHYFTPLAAGGVETLLAPSRRAAQIIQIRTLLRRDARRFAMGDFFSRAAGPSLPELSVGAARIHITYAPLPRGGYLRFTTADPVMRVALHEWFAAQSGTLASDSLATRRANPPPFDPVYMMSGYRDRPDGGVEDVTVMNRGDTRRIALIRDRLGQQARAFSRGGTAALESQTGAAPGRWELQAGITRVTIRYAPLPNGARINFKTSDPVLVTAIHQWFAAQAQGSGTQGMHM